MNIVVCVKNVPFTREADLTVDATGRGICTDNLVYVTNEWDDYATETAVRIKEERGGTVTAVTLGCEEDEEVLRRCLAMGADAAVRVDPGELEPDASVTAALLAAAVRTLPHDLVLTGVQSDDFNHGVVGALLAERLELPHVAVVNGLQIEDDAALVTVELEGGQDEVARVPLPGQATLSRRVSMSSCYVSIMGSAGLRASITVLPASGLGLTAADLEPALITEEIYVLSEAEGAAMLQGDATTVAAEILRLIGEKVGL